MNEFKFIISTILLCFLLTACAIESPSEPTENVPEQTSTLESDVPQPETASSEATEEAEDTLQRIREQGGFPFRLHYGSSKELIVITIENTGAKREQQVVEGYAEADSIYTQEESTMGNSRRETANQRCVE